MDRNGHLRSATLLKKRLWHRCFPVSFAKFLRTPFLQNTSGGLRLNEITKTERNSANSNPYDKKKTKLLPPCRCFQAVKSYNFIVVVVTVCNFKQGFHMFFKPL